MTPTIGTAYVLTGLRVDGRRPESSPMPPRIGRVVAIKGLELVVRLRLGTARHWCHRARTVTVENLSREATPREIQLGMPLEEGPVVRVLSRAEIVRLYGVAS